MRAIWMPCRLCFWHARHGRQFARKTIAVQEMRMHVYGRQARTTACLVCVMPWTVRKIFHPSCCVRAVRMFCVEAKHAQVLFASMRKGISGIQASM